MNIKLQHKIILLLSFIYETGTIIETNMGGSLTVHNIDGCAEFLIGLNVSTDTDATV
ncbi:MAG: hypothetical protein HQK88_03220 [Nitrospirae bacterium]|nr:hypothetical protein [Nitrospirota bacterium]MBF0536255.1 hypothetical protein [Nitrospirota bacterium]MBF0615811.1 hypothetical protein [Nitrospirota bacterium]